MQRSIGLSPGQLYELTGFKRPKRQCEALAMMAVPFMVRPNGTPFVSMNILETTVVPPKAVAVLGEL